MRYYVPYATPHGPSWYNLHMPVVRMVEHYSDPPSSAPPFSSMYDQTLEMGHLFKRQDTVRNNVRFFIHLKAGQSIAPNGDLGREFTPPIPEALGGRVYSSKA